ncbi:hypothetical protein [Brucella sp. NBRC 12950]|uniref:hypothetical protein n=1 Tax=Brucella sp. NBRC 12950 TaxID=2994518 RepID=UPI0024A3114D|nr:hypothetical protein [Brucella sp. NBRC 12950]GLU29917.1 hypothetical protein Brsp01_51500 [Brucella sp. NBRC 12950]
MEGLAGLMERAAALMPPFQSLVVAIVYCIGLLCALNSLRGFAAVSDRSLSPRGWSQAGWQGPAFLFVLAVAFVSLSSVMSVFLMSIFGMDQTYAASEAFAYAPQLLKPANNEMGRKVIISVIRIIQFIGLIAFVRGIYIANLSAIYPNRGMISKGMTHIVGGIFAMNLVAFLEILEKFLLNT